MISRTLFLVGACILSTVIISNIWIPGTWAQTIENPGFNDLSGWTTSNDATLAHPGGVAPWSWDTPVSAALIVNASETVLPTEGSGMGITYAGLDNFSQSVDFPNSGEYTISVDANALSGTSIGALVDGQFVFFVGSKSSPTNVVATANGWETFSWTDTFTAGSHLVGVRNTLTAPYAIAYDQFTVVPEPSTLVMLGLAASLLAAQRRRAIWCVTDTTGAPRSCGGYRCNPAARFANTRPTRAGSSLRGLCRG